MEPVSPALAGGFFTTEPPGKSNFILFRRTNIHFLINSVESFLKIFYWFPLLLSFLFYFVVLFLVS